MKTVDDFNFAGRRALVRVDFNVPLDKKDRHVTDDTRIRAALPTINKILGDGGSVVLMSHLGRPQAEKMADGSIDTAQFTLRHIAGKISALAGKEVTFGGDCTGAEAARASGALSSGEILLLENLRFHAGEEAGNEQFASALAKHGDCYVNDAFGTAHRAHASTAVVAKHFPGNRMFGKLMAGEIQNADKVLSGAQKPFAAIMGGAKVSDKLGILEKLIERADHILIGGGMAYTFLNALGGRIGNSLCEAHKKDLARTILDKAKARGVQLHLPADSVIAERFDAKAATRTVMSNAIPDGWMGLDIGPEASAAYREVIMNTKTILWNGPMGVFEMKPFESGTRAVGQAVADATNRGAFSLVGGGDSAAAVNKFGLADQVSYVSTGGGALLEYFEGKKLPGIEMMRE